MWMGSNYQDHCLAKFLENVPIHETAGLGLLTSNSCVEYYCRAPFLRTTNFVDFVDFGDFHKICYIKN